MASFIGHFIGLFTIGLMSLLFHELGHILAARWCRAEQIHLIIGAGKKIFAVTISRLIIRVHQLFFMHFVTISNRHHPYTSKEKIIISMLGPAFSIWLAIVFYCLLHVFAGYGLLIGFVFNLWLGFFNLLPFKIGQKTTDGYIIYKILTGSR